MIRKSYRQREIIQSQNPNEVNDRLNRLMEEKALQDPEITKEDYDPAIGHYVYVQWTVEIREPEDARDRAELEGKKYCCGECPFYVLQKDKRIKHSVCNKGNKTWYEHSACIELYEMIEKGEIEL